METSEQVGAPAANGNGHGGLVAALCRAQAKFPKLMKDQTAKVETRTGSGYSYRYSDLGSLLEAIRKVLNDEGIAVMQPIVYRDGAHFLETELAHISGESRRGEMRLTDHERPQELGSEITYKRRYSLSSMTGIASEIDDDGAAAQQAVKMPPRYQDKRFKGPVEGPPLSKDPKVIDAEEEQIFGKRNGPAPPVVAELPAEFQNDRFALEMAIARLAEQRKCTTGEKLALSVMFLNKKKVAEADPLNLVKLYLFLNDAHGVDAWRDEQAAR